MSESIQSPYRPPTVNSVLGIVKLHGPSTEKDVPYLYDARLHEYRLGDDPGADPVAEDRVCIACGHIVPLCSFCDNWAYHWWEEGTIPLSPDAPPMVREYVGKEVYVCDSHCHVISDEDHDDNDNLVAYGGQDCEECYDPW